MRSKISIALACVVFASVLAFSQGGGSLNANDSLAAGKQGPGSPPGKLTDIQAYEMLFRRVAYLQERAAMREEKGKDGQKLRSLIASKLFLGASEDQALKQVAFSCLQQVSALDAKATEIIRQERAKYPEGRSTNVSGRPKSPPILHTLQIERDNVLLHGRQLLKNQLGDFRFASFDWMMREYLTETSSHSLQR